MREECRSCGKRIDCLVKEADHCICLEVRDMEDCYTCVSNINSDTCDLLCGECDKLPLCTECEYTFCKYYGCPAIEEVLDGSTP